MVNSLLPQTTKLSLKYCMSDVCVTCMQPSNRCSSGMPTIYHVGDDGEAAAVMVPVSSTAIPIEDLPVYEVGIGFGLTKDKQKKRKVSSLSE